MNRSRRRLEAEENKRYTKSVRKLTEQQKEIVKSLAIHDASKMVSNISKIINEKYFQAMRENRVGKERANRILDRTGVLIDLEGKK